MRLSSVLGQRKIALVPRRRGTSEDLAEALTVEFGTGVSQLGPGPPGWFGALHSVPLHSAVIVDSRAEPLEAVEIIGELWRAEIPVVAIVEPTVPFPSKISPEMEYLRVEAAGREFGALIRLPRSQWRSNPSFSPRSRRPRLHPDPRLVPLDPEIDLADGFQRDAQREPRLITAQDTPRTTSRLRAGIVTAQTSPHPRGIAEVVVRACAWGLPLLVTPGALTGHIHPELLAEIGRAREVELSDALQREQYSVRLRRVLLRTHAGLPSPSVSIILATKRPDLVRHAAAQATKQAYRPLELVFAAHGEAVADEIRRLAIADRCREVGIDTVSVGASSSERFGVLLNRATEAASGRITTKMDDDDWYDPEHVADVVTALQWTGARLVGKAAEFIYLAELDRTVRRQATGSETWSTLISGATLTIHRLDLLEVGGWAPTNRAVDRRLVDAVVRLGEYPFRTHGFGFLVQRHGQGQTWDVATSYFLRRTYGQWRGLARREAMVDDP